MESFNIKLLSKSSRLSVPIEITIKPVTVNAYCSGEWIYDKKLEGQCDEDKCALLYLHGGAYHSGSTKTHRLITIPMAKRGASFGLKVLCINYRLAPRHKFPCALDDAIDALSFLYSEVSPRKVAVMGDSAGGGLSLATCLRAWQLGMEYIHSNNISNIHSY